MTPNFPFFIKFIISLSLRFVKQIYQANDIITQNIIPVFAIGRVAVAAITGVDPDIPVQ